MNTVNAQLHPRPDFERREWLSLDGNWEFSLFEKGNEEQERAFAENRASYTESICVPFSWTSPLSGIGRNVPGIGWYRKSVSYAPKGRLVLSFGAVDYLCDVFVNGMHVQRHQGGYNQFSIDVTDCWQDGENTIEVRAEDYQFETQTYGKQGYGDIQGIWQTVWLEDRPQEQIENFRFVTKISGKVDCTVFTNAADGKEVTATFGGSTFTGAVAGGKAEIAMQFDNPRLWSPDNPYLYEGTLTLGEDCVSTYFGIREIGTQAFGGRSYRWITLNGKPIYINATLDQAFHDKGHFTYPTDASMRDEAWRLKRLGLNAVRIHIKSELPRKLYWMDKLGVMVIADIPCFWGEPNEEAMVAYEAEWPVTFERDWNHPAIFQWVMFNETWGLFYKEPNPEKPGELKKVYKKETQERVRSVYLRAKEKDPTRIIEDNSPCYYDHVQTDINTWHFYLNGYETVKDHLNTVCDNTYPGSQFNCIGGNTQTDAPLMNSECGMVWGVDGSAGDSDLSWQYHYMLNEFRLHEKNCGFVFTEFHDVINEFNGYYRIDDTDKDWGYQDFCRGMTLRDLHADDFIAINCPPCRTMGPGEAAAVPMYISSFTDAHHCTTLSCEWELWHDGLDGRVCDDKGSFDVPAFGYGLTEIGTLAAVMPTEDAVAVLSVYLKDAAGNVICRNFTTFDVRRRHIAKNLCETSPAKATAEGGNIWRAHAEEKLCVAGSGTVSANVAVPEGSLNGLTLYFEASTKRLLRKDANDTDASGNGLSFMRGARVDRGSFPNSYFMTDEAALFGTAELTIEGVHVATIALGNDYADCRGVLSFHNQPNDRKLDEAGSYGELKRIEVPSRLIPAIAEKGSMDVRFTFGDSGFALYGRNSGRYPVALTVRSW